MIIFSRGRANPKIAAAAAVRRTAVISYYRKFKQQHKRSPKNSEIRKALGYTTPQVDSVFAWMRKHNLIEAVAK
jgi:hypothetical protein